MEEEEVEEEVNVEEEEPVTTAIFKCKVCVSVGVFFRLCDSCCDALIQLHESFRLIFNVTWPTAN